MLNHRFAGRLAACALILSGLPFAAQARDYAHGRLVITHPWSRPTPPSALSAVGYLTIVNTAKRPDRLLGGSSPAAKSVDVHLMSMAGGVMTMRPVAGGVVIPAGGTVDLSPNGYHLMLVGLKRPFKAGNHVPVTLTFQRAGKVKLNLEVEQPVEVGGGMPGMAMPGGHMDMH